LTPAGIRFCDGALLDQGRAAGTYRIDFRTA
jgi:hypothetical protein